MLGNSRKLRRLNTHRSRQHSNSCDWDNRNLDTDDFYETNLTNNKTCPCSDQHLECFDSAIGVGAALHFALKVEGGTENSRRLGVSGGGVVRIAKLILRS